ncbi:MAG: accessory gene regulator B family protein [Lachnospiraceae bacterium]|nr:accessory gene regulator B family protein [Lachnospiraceae bacterium]
MFHAISEKIAEFIISENEEQKSNREVLIYGIEILISDVVNLFVVLLTGLLFGHILCSLVFFISFAVLREKTGGYHADTHLKCNMVLAINTVLVMLVITWLTDKDYMQYIVVAAAVFSGIVIGMFSPRDNVNKRLDDYSKRRNKIQSLIIFFMLCSIMVILGALGYKAYSLTVSLSMLSVAIALMVKIKEL